MSELSPYSAPKSTLLGGSDSSKEIYRLKRYVIQDEEQAWPERCYRCNDKTDNTKELNVYHANPWIYLTILLSPLLTVIVYYIARKKFIVNLPICEKHSKHRKRFDISMRVTFIVLIVALVVGLILDKMEIVGVAVILLLLLVLVSIGGKIIAIVKRKDSKLWVSGTGKEFRNSLLEYPEARK